MTGYIIPSFLSYLIFANERHDEEFTLFAPGMNFIIVIISLYKTIHNEATHPRLKHNKKSEELNIFNGNNLFIARFL